MSKQLHTTVSRPFYSDAKMAKMCRNSSSSSHFLFPRDFSGTIADTDIINTLLEPHQPTNVHFGGFVDSASHFLGEIPQNHNFFGGGVNFEAKRGKY